MLVEGLINLILAIFPANVRFIYLPDYILLLFFVKLTFYKKKKSPFLIILLIKVILETIVLLSGSGSEFLFKRTILYGIATTIIFLWFIFASLEPYLRIKSIEGVKPWIKDRYLLLMAYGVFWIMSAILYIFFPEAEKEISLGSVLIMITFIIIPILEYFAWVMPKKYKNWLNRNYKGIDNRKELTKEEILNEFKRN